MGTARELVVGSGTALQHAVVSKSSAELDSSHYDPAMMLTYPACS